KLVRKTRGQRQEKLLHNCTDEVSFKFVGLSRLAVRIGNGHEPAIGIGDGDEGGAPGNSGVPRRRLTLHEIRKMKGEVWRMGAQARWITDALAKINKWGGRAIVGKKRLLGTTVPTDKVRLNAPYEPFGTSRRLCKDDWRHLEMVAQKHDLCRVCQETDREE